MNTSSPQELARKLQRCALTAITMTRPEISSMTKRDILLFTENYFGGGSDFTVYQYYRALQGVDYNISVLANDACVSRLIGLGISKGHCFRHRFITYGSAYSWTSSQIRRSSKVIMKAVFILRPVIMAINIARYFAYVRANSVKQVLIFNGGYPGSEACCAMAIAGRLAGASTAMSIVNTPEQRRGLWSQYERIIDFVTWRACKTVIVNGTTLRSALVSRRHAYYSNIIVIHNCLEDCHATRRSAPLGEIRIGLICRLSKEKNVESLIRVFATLRDKGYNIALYIAGDGPQKKELEEISNATSCGNTIHFVGRIDHESTKAEFLSLIDIYAFPSVLEGFPYSILEAMRSGCAIVSSDAGSIRDALRHNENAFVFAAGEDDKMSDLLEILLQNRKLRMKLGEKVRADFLNNYLETSMTQKIQALTKSGLI